MTVISMTAAVITALLTSLFSGFPGPFPILLFLLLLIINCECMAACVLEEEKTSMLFMAVICNALVVLLCAVLFSGNLNTWLCDLGLQDPDTVHPLVPVLTLILTGLLFRFLLKKAEKNQLSVQKYAAAINKKMYTPGFWRYRKMMIREGILTERPHEEE